MDLIELSEQLEVYQIVELLARKLLTQEQALCKYACGNEALDEMVKRPYRNTLANAQALAISTKEAAQAKLFASGRLVSLLDVAIEQRAEEYTRIV